MSFLCWAMVKHTFNLSTQEEQQADLCEFECEFEASLVNRVRSRTTRTTQKKTLQNQNRISYKFILLRGRRKVYMYTLFHLLFIYLWWWAEDSMPEFVSSPRWGLGQTEVGFSGISVSMLFTKPSQQSKPASY